MAGAQVDELKELLTKLGRDNKLALDQVPPVNSNEQRAAYDALASELYANLEGPPEERSRSPKGQLAAALWQRIDEWNERAEESS